jgi:hypothetical protein
MRYRLAAIALLSAWLLAGCGGDSGGGPTGPAPPPEGSIVFTGTGSPGVNSIALVQGSGTSASTLVLNVEATSVNDLFGVAFDLSFPSSSLAYQGATEGTFVSGGGQAATSFEVAQGATGNLIVGLTRLGDVNGASGTGTLMTIRLGKVSGGSGPVAFQNRQAVDSAGGTLPVSWSGGTVVVPD